MAIAMQQPDYLSQNRPWPDYWGLFCLAVALVGLGVRAFTVGCVPERTSGRNTKEGHVANRLNVAGMYSIVRHPLYLGNFIIWIGVAMYCAVWWLVAIVALLFCVYYERIIFAEEEFLRYRFGGNLSPVGGEDAGLLSPAGIVAATDCPSRCGPCSAASTRACSRSWPRSTP